VVKGRQVLLRDFLDSSDECWC